MTNQYWDDGAPVDRRDRSARPPARNNRREPHSFVRQHNTGPTRAEQRDFALARQVQRILAPALMLLDGVTDLRVMPAPDSSRLAVLIAVRIDAIEAVHAAANTLVPRLRAEVAHGIARKRVPEITVVVVPTLTEVAPIPS